MRVLILALAALALVAGCATVCKVLPGGTPGCPTAPPAEPTP